MIKLYTADNFYNNKYFEKNPSLHEEDSKLKAKEVLHSFKYLPTTFFDKKRIRILDVGGGCGMVASLVKQEMESKSLSVDILGLDISPKMIEIQQKNTGDNNFKGYVGSVEKIPKEIKADVTLMLDVLEHVPNYKKALEELGRVSEYVIFRVPIDNSAILNIFDRILNGRVRRYFLDKYGHVHSFSLKQLEDILERELGTIIHIEILDDYIHGFKLNISTISSLFNLAGAILFKINKQLALKILFGSVMVVVDCSNQFATKDECGKDGVLA